MTDKERLERIQAIATRSLKSIVPLHGAVKWDLRLIITLCSSTDEFLKLNADKFETPQENSTQ